MKSTLLLMFCVVSCLVTASGASACRADLILELGDVTWDRASAAPQLNFSVLADNNTSLGVNSNNINSFNLVFTVRPASGAIGTLGVQVTAPSANPLFSSFSDLSSNFDNGTGFYFVQGQNVVPPVPNAQPSNVSLLPGTRRNLVALNFSPSVNAEGEFAIFVSSTSNRTFVNEFDGVAFRNLPFNDPPTELRLGSLSISAVPEPSSIALISLGLLAIKTIRRRKAFEKP